MVKDRIVANRNWATTVILARRVGGTGRRRSKAIDRINRPRKPVTANRLKGNKIGKRKAAAKLRIVRCVSRYLAFLCFSNLNMSIHSTRVVETQEVIACVLQA